MNTLARFLLLTSRFAAAVAIATFVAAWCCGVALTRMEQRAGGKPHHVDLATGKRYVQEKSSLIEVSPRAYDQMVLTRRLCTDVLPTIAIASLASAAALFLASRGIKSRFGRDDRQVTSEALGLTRR